MLYLNNEFISITKKTGFQYILLISFFLLPFCVNAQSDYISLNDNQYAVLNRLDIKLRADSLLSFSTVKPFNRKRITERVEFLDSLYKTGNSNLSLSGVDKYNIKTFLESNAEWTRHYSFQIKKQKGLFTAPEHLYAVKEKDYSFVVDPVLNLQAGKSNLTNSSIYINTRGVLIRGELAHKIAFYTYLSDNQEKDPQYVQDFVTKFNALPGQGFYKPYNTTGYDYFNIRGGVSFNAGTYFDLQLAYDKLFIGNGYRSLLLSDFSSNYTYLRFVTHIGKVNYEAILAETTAPFSWNVNSHLPLPQNYLAVHHLSMQLGRKLNVGLYENSMESGRNGFRFGYLNPIIFYKALEQDYGMGGKTSLGFDLKWNALKNIQFYNQIMITDLNVKEITNYGHGSYSNKIGLQLGLKYLDAFAIKNLDLQGEANFVRPYTYTNASDSSTNLTNFNQPLAHPLGANFREFIFIAKLQPAAKVYLTAKVFYHEQGLDSAGLNMGSDIFRSYNSRPRDYGFKIGSGILAKSLLASFTLSVETFPNFFIEGNLSYRTYSVPMNNINTNELFYTLGVRWNIARRDFEF